MRHKECPVQIARGVLVWIDTVLAFQAMVLLKATGSYPSLSVTLDHIFIGCQFF